MGIDDARRDDQVAEVFEAKTGWNRGLIDDPGDALAFDEDSGRPKAIGQKNAAAGKGEFHARFESWSLPATDGCPDVAEGLARGDENFIRVFQTEWFEVGQQMVLIGHADVDFVD